MCIRADEMICSWQPEMDIMLSLQTGIFTDRLLLYTLQLSPHGKLLPMASLHYSVVGSLLRASLIACWKLYS